MVPKNLDAKANLGEGGGMKVVAATVDGFIRRLVRYKLKQNNNLMFVTDLTVNGIVNCKCQLIGKL